MIKPREFFVALERGDRSRTVEGFSRLTHACASVRHPYVFEARKDRSGEALQDLVREYLTFLFSKEGRPQRLLLQEWPGVRVSFFRFLKRTRPKDRSLDRSSGLYEGLLFDKLRRVLRSDARFVIVPPRRPARFHLKTPPCELLQRSQDELLATLPKVKALLAPVGNKSPEVARAEDLADQAERVFAWTGNAPRTVDSMHATIWETLHPRPEDVRRVAPSTDGGGDPLDRVASEDSDASRNAELRDPEARVAELEFIDELAYPFLAGLSPRCLRVVRQRWLSRRDNKLCPYEEIEAALGIPRATAQRDAEAFEAALRAEVGKHGMSEDDAAAFLNVVWEILDAGDFLTEAGGTP